MKTTRTFRIQNNSGDWWTGSCFGVEQCAEKYDSLDDLPTEIDGLGLEIHDDDPSKPDARYYAADMDGELLMESEAGVRMTEEETFDDDDESESNSLARILFPDDCSHAYRAKLEAAAIRLDYQIEWFDDPAACESAGGETANANRIYSELCEFVGSENV